MSVIVRGKISRFGKEVLVNVNDTIIYWQEMRASSTNEISRVTIQSMIDWLIKYKEDALKG
jgi:hypothetical protein